MSQKKVIAPIAVLFGIALLISSGDAQEVSTTICRKVSAPIIVDGVLDEPAWKATEQIELVNTTDGSKAQFRTTTAVLWDDDVLYINFVCADPDMWATKLNRDDPLWEEEVVEVFIDPDGDGKGYAELEVNPLNVVVDLHIITIKPTWNSDINWDIAGLQTAVTVEGTVNEPGDEDVGWTVEIAIPWAGLAGIPGAEGPPVDGAQWRINLYRIERPRDADWHLLAWSPTSAPAFHVPERFGAVTFSTQTIPTPVEDWTWGRIKWIDR